MCTATTLVAPHPTTYIFAAYKTRRETLGRFPEMAVREHFLEQMRKYMIGGGTAMSQDSDSPHHTGQQHSSVDNSSSSLEDSREMLRQQQQQMQIQMQQQQQQQVRMECHKNGTKRYIPLGQTGRANRVVGLTFLLAPFVLHAALEGWLCVGSPLRLLFSLDDLASGVLYVG